MADRKVDQEAIAERLGLSRSTVTRVLRHDPSHRIAPATRRLVLDMAVEMGYTPRRRKTANIAFVVCGEMASLQHELHLAVCHEALKHGYRVFLAWLPERPTYKQLSAYVNPLSVDGAIIVGHFDEEPVTSLAAILPVVILDGSPDCRGADRVLVDHVELGRMLTERMINLGHRELAVITQFPWDIAWAGPLEGYRQAMVSAGLHPELSRVRTKYRRLYPELLGELLAMDPRPTAILALTTSDHAVILSTLLAMGVKVPVHLSYVGWATAYMSALLSMPTITCLDDMFQSVAAAAVRRVLHRAEDPSIREETLVVPVTLRVGETCALRKDGESRE